MQARLAQFKAGYSACALFSGDCPAYHLEPRRLLLYVSHLNAVFANSPLLDAMGFLRMGYDSLNDFWKLCQGCADSSHATLKVMRGALPGGGLEFLNRPSRLASIGGAAATLMTIRSTRKHYGVLPPFYRTVLGRYAQGLELRVRTSSREFVRLWLAALKDAHEGRNVRISRDLCVADPDLAGDQWDRGFAIQVTWTPLQKEFFGHYPRFPNGPHEVILSFPLTPEEKRTIAGAGQAQLSLRDSANWLNVLETKIADGLRIAERLARKLEEQRT